MTQSPNLTARPEIITPAAPMIFEGVNDHGFAFRFEIRTARINGKRWAAAPDVMKAAGVRTHTASGKRKGTTNFLVAVPGNAKRLIQRHECPALFNLDGAPNMNLLSREGVERFLEGRLNQPGVRQLHAWLTTLPTGGRAKAAPETEEPASR